MPQSGEDALEKLGQSSVDLVLMDCQMPKSDGYAATRCYILAGRGHGLRPVSDGFAPLRTFLT